MPNYLIVLCLVLVLLTGCDKAAPSGKTMSPPARITQYDAGAPTVNVSAYQVRIRWWYHRFFSSECSKCHTAARPLNAPYQSKEEWAEIIQRMKAKEGADISDSDAESIEKFLIYDAKKRKSGE